MTIFLIGWFIIPIGLVLFIKFPVKLLYATVFFIPFTGTAVFKFNFDSFDAQGIRASMFLGFLYLLRSLISSVYRGKIRYPNRFFSMHLLFGLMGIVVISLVMPFLISGKLNVLDGYSDLVYYAKETPLYFKAQYLTQVLYFVFGCFVSYAIGVQNSKPEILIKLIKVYIASSVFICVWGLFELICFYSDIAYPAFLFNQNSMNYAGTLVLDGVPRISSAALEPSILSQQLLTSIPFLFWSSFYRSYFFSKKGDRIALGLISTVLILSLSTSAFVGLAIIYLLIALNLFAREKIKVWFLVFNLIIIVGFILSLPFLFEEISAKIHSFSGIERFRAISYGWKYFLDYPLLGIGWGVLPSLDLIINILTGVGLVGLFAFTLLLVSIYFRLFFIKGTTPLMAFHIHGLVDGAIYSLGILLIISQISGFIYHSQYFWFILGISIAVGNIRRQKLYSDKEFKAVV